jgi:hypothetical protein
VPKHHPTFQTRLKGFVFQETNGRSGNALLLAENLQLKLEKLEVDEKTKKL